MAPSEVKQALTGIHAELEAILSRFSHTREGIHIDQNDEPRFRQLVQELIDLIKDELSDQSYGRSIANHFNDGVSNWTGSPSYASVENIEAVVGSVINRIERTGRTDWSPKTNQMKSQAGAAASLKERFESHPLIFGLSLIAAGFLAGVGLSEWSLNFRQQPAASIDRSEIAAQVEALTKEHNHRLGKLYEDLREREREAVHGGNLESTQAIHRDAADRIRISISEENNSYRGHLEQLMRIMNEPAGGA